jgi:pyrroline-5-carboxylate reductase
MQGKLSIGFLGAGKMATALAGGFVRARLLPARQIVASDVAEAARQAFGKAVAGARITASNREVIERARVVVLAVKPNQVEGVLADIRPAVGPRHLLISIAAGVPLARLQSALGETARLVRVMPNTPALVGAAACGFALGAAAKAQDAKLVQKLLSSVGDAHQVKESLLDAVTGLSGSGPAYAFLMIEAMSDGGVAAGLPRDVATRLAAQTLLGSARMVLETGLHPGALKDMVTSPGGTTIDGLYELERNGVRGALMSAVCAATAKARKLSQG